jgi:dienelactone hydrolase
MFFLDGGGFTVASIPSTHRFRGEVVMFRRFAAGFLLSFVWLSSVVPAKAAVDTPLNEQVLGIPLVREERPPGEQTLYLEATVYRPDGNGRFPLLVLSHGIPPGADEEDRRSMTRQRYFEQSAKFVKMGFVVVIPMRRGYAQSEGGWAEDSGKCSNADYYDASLSGARDILATVNYLRDFSYVDGSRIILAGYSVGGFDSLAAAGEGFEGLLGIINFSGGRGSAKPGSICNEDNLVRAASRFGANVNVPSLWLYSENDRHFSPDVARKLFDAFTGSGASATLVFMPPFGKDGHLTFSREQGIRYWLPAVKSFLYSIDGLRLGW